MNNIIKARIVQADVPNANGRTYPREVLEAAMKQVELSGQNRLFATLGMPEGATISLTEICAIVGNLAFDEENFLVGDVIPLQTPNGDHLKEMLAAGLKFDYRLAGIGTIEENVVRDFKFMAIGVLPEGTGS